MQNDLTKVYQPKKHVHLIEWMRENILIFFLNFVFI